MWITFTVLLNNILSIIFHDFKTSECNVTSDRLTKLFSQSERVIVSTLKKFWVIDKNVSLRIIGEYRPCFIALKYTRTKKSRSWVIGTYEIMELEKVNHLGIFYDKYSSSSTGVKHYDRKLRGSFFGLIKEGLHRNGLNPITSFKIYKSVVLPRALFGSEMLQTLSDHDTLTLERSHRLCLKQIQGLRNRSRTDVVLGLVGALPIQAYIEQRKMNLFGQLCRLQRDCAAKKLFLYRLCSFFNDASFQGFVPDIVNIFTKYDLLYLLDNYRSFGVFPEKPVWKRYFWPKIKSYFVNEWELRTSSPEFVLYRQIQVHFSFSPLWCFARSHPGLLNACFSVAKLLAYLPLFNSVCSRCEKDDITLNITEHILTECETVNGCRIFFYRTIYNCFGAAVLNYLRALHSNNYVKALFGLDENLELILGINIDYFYHKVVIFLHVIWRCYSLNYISAWSTI